MSYATARQALSSLFCVLEPDQKIDYIYRGGMNAGRSVFSFQIRGQVCGVLAKDAEEAALRLKQNLELVLAARPGLCFGKAPFQGADSPEFPPKWRGSLYPQGVLISSGQALKCVAQDELPNAVLITPLVPVVTSDLSVVDVVLSSPGCGIYSAPFLGRSQQTDVEKPLTSH